MAQDEVCENKTYSQWLRNQNEYDLMIKLQERLDLLLKGQNPCSIYILTGMNFISAENYEFCLHHDCKNCIQIWLNRDYK